MFIQQNHVKLLILRIKLLLTYHLLFIIKIIDSIMKEPFDEVKNFSIFCTKKKLNEHDDAVYFLFH